MALTFTQLTDEVLFNAFEGAGFTTRAQRFLNEAVNEVGRRLGFPMKAYEVAAYATTGTVTLTQPFHRIEEVWISAGPTATAEAALVAQCQRRLAPINNDSAGVLTISGQPRTYQTEHVAGDRPLVALKVFPATPAGFVGVVGRALPPVMSAGSDLSGLGGEFDDALVCFARSRCFRTEDDFQAAQVWMAEFDQHLRTLAKARISVQDGPIITPGSWDDGSAPVSGGC